MLKIELTEKNFCAGSLVQGKVFWQIENEPEQAEIRLFWYTQGKGTTDLEVVQTQKFENPQQADERDFSLQLPAAPYSFSGKLISLVWALELVIEPGDWVERAEITMSATGAEVVLGTIE